MKKKLKANEKRYWFIRYRHDPEMERVQHLLDFMRRNGDEFLVKRGYHDRVTYSVILDSETVTFITLSYSDILSPRDL